MHEHERYMVFLDQHLNKVLFEVVAYFIRWRRTESLERALSHLR
jgi:hypothetical protein